MSRTVAAAIVSIVVGLLTMLGVTMPMDLQQTLTNHIDLAIGSVVTIYGIVLWIFRAITSSPLVGYFKKDKQG